VFCGVAMIDKRRRGGEEGLRALGGAPGERFRGGKRKSS